MEKHSHPENRYTHNGPKARRSNIAGSLVQSYYRVLNSIVYYWLVYWYWYDTIDARWACECLQLTCFMYYLGSRLAADKLCRGGEPNDWKQLQLQNRANETSLQRYILYLNELLLSGTIVEGYWKRISTHTRYQFIWDMCEKWIVNWVKVMRS